MKRDLGKEFYSYLTSFSLDSSSLRLTIIEGFYFDFSLYCYSSEEDSKPVMTFLLRQFELKAKNRNSEVDDEFKAGILDYANNIIRSKIVIKQCSFTEDTGASDIYSNLQLFELYLIMADIVFSYLSDKILQNIYLSLTKHIQDIGLALTTNISNKLKNFTFTGVTTLNLSFIYKLQAFHQINLNNSISDSTIISITNLSKPHKVGTNLLFYDEVKEIKVRDILSFDFSLEFSQNYYNFKASHIQVIYNKLLKSQLPDSLLRFSMRDLSQKIGVQLGESTTNPVLFLYLDGSTGLVQISDCLGIFSKQAKIDLEKKINSELFSMMTLSVDTLRFIHDSFCNSYLIYVFCLNNVNLVQIDISKDRIILEAYIITYVKQNISVTVHAQINDPTKIRIKATDISVINESGSSKLTSLNLRQVITDSLDGIIDYLIELKVDHNLILKSILEISHNSIPDIQLSDANSHTVFFQLSPLLTEEYPFTKAIELDLDYIAKIKIELDKNYYLQRDVNFRSSNVIDQSLAITYRESTTSTDPVVELQITPKLNMSITLINNAFIIKQLYIHIASILSFVKNIEKVSKLLENCISSQFAELVNIEVSAIGFKIEYSFNPNFCNDQIRDILLARSEKNRFLYYNLYVFDKNKTFYKCHLTPTFLYQYSYFFSEIMNKHLDFGNADDFADRIFTFLIFNIVCEMIACLIGDYQFDFYKGLTESDKVDVKSYSKKTILSFVIDKFAIALHSEISSLSIAFEILQYNRIGVCVFDNDKLSSKKFELETQLFKKLSPKLFYSETFSRILLEGSDANDLLRSLAVAISTFQNNLKAK